MATRALTLLGIASEIGVGGVGGGVLGWRCAVVGPGVRPVTLPKRPQVSPQFLGSGMGGGPGGHEAELRERIPLGRAAGVLAGWIRGRAPSSLLDMGQALEAVGAALAAGVQAVRTPDVLQDASRWQ